MAGEHIDALCKLYVILTDRLTNPFHGAYCFFKSLLH